MAKVAIVANEVRDAELARRYQEEIERALEGETGAWWVWILIAPEPESGVTVRLKYLTAPVYLSRKPQAPTTIRGLREEDWTIDGADGPEAVRRSVDLLRRRHA
jgi:hypothetical protein